NFFASLGSAPMLGRTILPEDDQPGAHNRVVILSYALWQRRFGADPDILGQTLMVNAEPYAVLGVMPAGFDFPSQSDMWCPPVPGGAFHDNRRAHCSRCLLTSSAANRTVTSAASWPPLPSAL